MAEVGSPSNERLALRTAGVFLLIRIPLLIALPLEGIRGYGDYPHFIELAKLGRPFLDFWVEFPPIFPFFSSFLYQWVGGREHSYSYLLAFILTLAQSGNVYLFTRLAMKQIGGTSAERTSMFYLALLAGLPFGWWYFDPFAVFALLLGLTWLLEGKTIQIGVVTALGALTKWFPGILVIEIWRSWEPRKAFRASLAMLVITIAVYGGLLLSSPEMTTASIRSQWSKGSWETVWALIDGNLSTGNFGPEEERYSPSTALEKRGQPAKIPPWITLLIFAGIGMYLFIRIRDTSPQTSVVFLGITWVLFLIWSPGWSPQWVLYLIPLTLLGDSTWRGKGFAAAFTLIALLEWPILLSRGRFDLLWIPVIVRTLLLVLLVVNLVQIALAHQTDNRGVV